jgi:hypothetical protein
MNISMTRIPLSQYAAHIITTKDGRRLPLRNYDVAIFDHQFYLVKRSANNGSVIGVIARMRSLHDSHSEGKTLLPLRPGELRLEHNERDGFSGAVGETIVYGATIVTSPDEKARAIEGINRLLDGCPMPFMKWLLYAELRGDPRAAYIIGFGNGAAPMADGIISGDGRLENVPAQDVQVGMRELPAERIKDVPTVSKEGKQPPEIRAL